MDPYGYKQGMLKMRLTQFDSEEKVTLPHMCDEWNIGDEDNLQILISDARALLEELVPFDMEEHA